MGSSYAAHTYVCIVASREMHSEERRRTGNCLTRLWGEMGDHLALAVIEEKKADGEPIAPLANLQDDMADLERGNALRQGGGWYYLRALHALKTGQEQDGRIQMARAAGRGHPYAIRWCQNNGEKF